MHTELPHMHRLRKSFNAIQPHSLDFHSAWTGGGNHWQINAFVPYGITKTLFAL